MRACCAVSRFLSRLGLAFLLSITLSTLHSPAQQIPGTPVSGPQPDGNRPDDRALPDIPTLMHQVEEHQRTAEQIQKDYIYHSVETSVDVDKHGGVKKTEVNEYDVFWITGVPVRKMVRKNGRELTPDEIKKESDRLDKEAAKAHEKRDREEAKGKQTDPRGNDVITVSRFLELGSFTNPRRVKESGRDTILVDYAGDPNAKSKTSFENVVRDMAGTLWIDEQDKVIARLQGHFVDTFKMGGGLLVSVQKDTSFAVRQQRINNEVWLPARVEGKGEARVFLFFKFSGSLTVVNSDYRKFKATTTLLPVPAEPSVAPK